MSSSIFCYQLEAFFLFLLRNIVYSWSISRDQTYDRRFFFIIETSPFVRGIGGVGELVHHIPTALKPVRNVVVVFKAMRAPRKLVRGPFLHELMESLFAFDSPRRTTTHRGWERCVEITCSRPTGASLRLWGHGWFRAERTQQTAAGPHLRIRGAFANANKNREPVCVSFLRPLAGWARERASDTP